MTIFSVRHITVYRYLRPVNFGEHRLMFRPRDSYDQRLLCASLMVDPQPGDVRWIHDVFGNCVTLVEIPVRASELRFETRIRLDHTPQAAPDLQIDAEALTYPFNYSSDEIADLACTIERQYLDDDDEVGRWARQFVHVGRPTDTGALLMTLCYAIHESFAYARRLETGTQPPLITLRLRRGTCRDFALLMIEAVRSLGLAARFVTGYVYVAERDGSDTRGGGSTHAWCQVYLPGAGWVEFDPTNGIVGNRDLIRVAVARQPRQAIPLTGSYGGVASDYAGMSVQVNVTTDGTNQVFDEQLGVPTEPSEAVSVHP
ncbi:transglutaminase family protein [Phyllobacterium zundukense]|uniref:Transglutaminase n=1 Tax=Phyllobacterium zundukense TaxID=1867719 RepID=A0A2N9VVH6_9HYPH|nr:transglutaminase family protein [Phyllobacterium zundukense]ATU94991.1 transglutaminase [Phyllobacterium zundukense]PIO43494.1 transglutaminase [Phyllobacterium zundukense]